VAPYMDTGRPKYWFVGNLVGDQQVGYSYESIQRTLRTNSGMSKQNWTGLIAMGKILTLVLCMEGQDLSNTTVVHENIGIGWKP
jgi:hypothetical protein